MNDSHSGDGNRAPRDSLGLSGWKLRQAPVAWALATNVEPPGTGTRVPSGATTSACNCSDSHCAAMARVGPLPEALPAPDTASRTGPRPRRACTRALQ